MPILLITHKPSLAHSAKRVYSIANGQSQLVYGQDQLNENQAVFEQRLFSQTNHLSPVEDVV